MSTPALPSSTALIGGKRSVGRLIDETGTAELPRTIRMDAEAEILVEPAGIFPWQQRVFELSTAPLLHLSGPLIFEHCIVLPTGSDAFSSAMTMRLTDPDATTAPSPGLRGGGLENSTDVVLGVPPLVESQFSEAAALAATESFEEGIESRFSVALSTLVHVYGLAAIAAIENFVRSPSSSIEVAAEAIEWLGEAAHPASQRYRRTLLELLLSSTSTRLRHGAAAGLASMDDPESLPALREAYDRESNGRLRAFIELILDQLEHTRACRNS